MHDLFMTIDREVEFEVLVKAVTINFIRYSR